MEDGFGGEARIAIAAARAMARATGTEFASTEHLLLGIVAHGRGVGACVLGLLGVESSRIREAVALRIVDGKVGPGDGEAFSPRARRALDLALVEADERNDGPAGTEHLLLGLLRETEGGAARALAELGVGPEDVRRVVEEARSASDAARRNLPLRSEVRSSTMWQRFTERARKVVFYAQEEAQKFGEGYVSTEHLLLGLVREPDSVAARVLERTGVSLDRVRVEVEKQLPRGDARAERGHLLLTPRAKRVIDLARDEARNLNNDHIGTEHLLLGLIREGDGLAGRVLAKLGVELERARREVIALQDNEAGGGGSPAGREPVAPPPDPWTRFEDGARRAFVAAEAEALTRGQSFRSPEHLLLGLLAEPESPAGRALAALGVDLDRLRAATESRCRTAPPRGGEAPLSPAGTQSFSLAYKEQTMLGAKRTGTEHVLLGLLREPDGVAGRVLEEFGVELRALRAAIRDLDEGTEEG